MGPIAWLRMQVARMRAHRYPTRYGTARVYEVPWSASMVRVLDVDGTYQSAAYVDDRWCDLVFPYLRLFDCAFEDRNDDQSLLMLGGGGCSYARHVVAHHPHARIDVVESDPAIVGIARRHFYLDRLEDEYAAESSGRLSITCEDALDYLAACARSHRTYDTIVNDCFVARDAVASLSTREAAQVLHECLVPGGLYVVNVIAALDGSEAEPLFALVGALCTQFAHIGALPCGRVDAQEADNVVVVATDSPRLPRNARVLYDAG